MNAPLLFAFQTLDEVYRRDAYCSQVLADVLVGLDDRDKRMVTRIVYGVLQNEFRFNWAIAQLCAKQPKAVVRVLLKMGMYLLDDMQSMPPYACVNEMVNLTKAVKKDYVGFVNATLKAYAAATITPPADPVQQDSLRYNLPPWLVQCYYSQYGVDGARARLGARRNHTHLRPNSQTYSIPQLVDFCTQRHLDFVSTPHGILVGATQPFAPLLADGRVTVQALDSIYIACALLADLPQGDLLDLCAAPGGKSVYMAEATARRVVACDIHAHRVGLIKAYCARMHTQGVQPTLADGTVDDPLWHDAFAGVLVDAPCSGLGVAMANPDIVLRRTPQGMAGLAATQTHLLDTAARYVAVGGVLVYSTCTDLDAENGTIVRQFVATHPHFVVEPITGIPFVNDGMHQFDPDEGGNEGFFVARLRRRA